MHKLKSSQKDRCREFITLTQTGEKTALYCLAQHDWKLDIALDNYFANPDMYYREPRSAVDRKKLESVYNRSVSHPETIRSPCDVLSVAGTRIRASQRRSGWRA